MSVSFSEFIDTLSPNEYYTGIGSRKTPKEIQTQIEKIAQNLAKRKLILRSGGAIGADMAFEKGARKEKDISPVIYRPETFDSSSENYQICKEELISILDSKLRFASLQPFTKRLFLRNINQVLGLPGEPKSKFLICWTPHENYDQIDCGGSRIAIRIAKKYQIPVWNLVNERDFDSVFMGLSY